MTVLVTGATGHLGPHLIAELLAGSRFERVYIVARPSAGPATHRIEAIEGIARATLAARGILADGTHVIAVEGHLVGNGLGLPERDASHLAGQLQVIVHAAADTRFAAPVDALRAVNVDGTRAICEFAARCGRLRQLLFVSTACVAGRRIGRVPERILDDAAGFVNGYEQSKWEAEGVVADSGLPARIARLTTCVGGHHTGYVHRFGAVHHLLHWISRGLIPMIPGTTESRLDLISTDVAAGWLARAALEDPIGVEVCQVALGDRAIALAALLDYVVAELQDSARRTRIARPIVVDRDTFGSFQQIVRSSGDALFARVQASAGAMLPSLLFPKVYETGSAEQCWGGPLPHPDWRLLLSQLIAVCRGREWAAETA